MTQTFQIVRARPENAAALTEIAFTAKRHWGYPEQWIESWNTLLTISPTFVLQHETCRGGKSHLGLLRNLLPGPTAPGGLEHLWVIPQAMGLGIGRSMFTHAVQTAGQLGFQELVIESDPNAEGFYLRMGAVRVGTKVMELEGERRELPVLRFSLLH